ncbi:hypothetical protein BELL_0536g00090 [Botrytis elliptica]|uniref:Uncharacterized protein n=1 Tax=Botrytis elliptica TaxID=278938 RepID=A0A4Z1JR55_9HELO|nr:hypothetical protein BELL_0536g00090 [Botrytis elliptica]
MPFTDMNLCYMNPINIRDPAKDACLYSSPASVPPEDFVVRLLEIPQAAISHPSHHRPLLPDFCCIEMLGAYNVALMNCHDNCLAGAQKRTKHKMTRSKEG